MDIFFKKKSNSNILLKLKKNKNNTVLLTNVAWDAQVHFKENIFSNMLEWLFFTIDHYKNNPKKNLIIRIHPAEIYGSVPSNQKVFDEIKNKYKEIPNNIFIIKPDEKLSTYDLFDLSQDYLIYSTKTGIELAALGKNVVACGEAWCKNKGFTIDPQSKDEYLKILKNLNGQRHLNYSQIRLAKKYAYYIFFKRMISVKSVNKLNFLSPFTVNNNAINLKDPGLDFIVESILNNNQFIYEQS